MLAVAVTQPFLQLSLASVSQCSRVYCWLQLQLIIAVWWVVFPGCTSWGLCARVHVGQVFCHLAKFSIWQWHSLFFVRCGCVCTPGCLFVHQAYIAARGGQRRHQVPWNLSYRWLWAFLTAEPSLAPAVIFFKIGSPAFPFLPRIPFWN